MKLIANKRVESEIEFVRITAAVRYEEEDMPNDYPGRSGESWCVLIDAVSGQIQNWPKGVPARDLHMKVCDCGTYDLIDKSGTAVHSVENDYVPSWVPNEYGDYLTLDIDERGRITNWPSTKVLDLTDGE